MATRVFAPAKINLCLHVTDQRPDGYHVLESLVCFADVGDWITLGPSDRTTLRVTGPKAAAVPTDGSNLCMKAAALACTTVAITLEKHLPAAAGIGGGSADAAAVLRGLSDMTGQAPDFDPAQLGADVPVCMESRAAIMAGIGEQVTPVTLPPLNTVLVNPGVSVSTAEVFTALASKTNPAMDRLPDAMDVPSLMAWLARQRNDLEPPARAAAPIIDTVLGALGDAELARMSGSGATCFGIYKDAEAAKSAAEAITVNHPDWWVAATVLR